MSGLGQAGTAVSKNVFGGGTTFGQNQQTTNLFGEYDLWKTENRSSKKVSS